jgi:hypothetical protein
MTTRNVPDSGNSARHGTDAADLTIMIAAHTALRRDLQRLARAAAFVDLPDPARRASVRAGWETFKRQLHLHHTTEDTIIWPAMRSRLSHSESAQSVLDAMEAEHQQIDPLLIAVDGAFARAEEGHRNDARAIGDVTDALTTSLTGHLAHEERDGLPLIGVAFTADEWRSIGFKMARKNGLSGGAEMFAWLADGADPDQAAAAIGTLPPPARLAYRAIWKPRYERTARW